MKIFLVGFMASGKSSTGKKLAKLLNFDFLDTDVLIEVQEKRTISDIIHSEGEDSFRKIEQRILSSLEKIPNAVVATGGGLPCYQNNMETLKAMGLVVFLEINSKEVFQRLIQNDRKAIQTRPLLQNKTDIELADFIENMLEMRTPIYALADLTFSATQLKIHEIIDSIHLKLEEKENEEFLQSTFSLDFEKSEIQNFVRPFTPIKNKTTAAIELYRTIRDLQIYDPYHLDLRKNSLQASTLLVKKRAWCVEKSILLAACARALNIPSKLGFAIVKNHLDIERLQKYLQKDEIVFHGYVSLYLNKKWVRCTPAFDKRVCRLSKVAPLDFDGINDSMFQEHTENGQFMSYLHYYGEFADLPIDLMRDEMKKHYPHLFETQYNSKEFSFLY